jgi:CheY-like chemotaxis protein
LKASDHGSEFNVRLPLSKRAAPAARARPFAIARRGRVEPRRIPVVDDNVAAALRVASVLKLWGHDVETAFNGPDALGKARSFRPQVVLSGIGMPGMSGYEVVKQLRAERDFDAMVNTSLTGYGQADDHL